MVDPLIDTWRIGSKVVQYVLVAVAPESLGDRGATKGRSVGEIFAHTHNVRLMWLQSAAPALLAGLAKIEKDAAGGDKIGLDTALIASADAIAAGRVRGFKPHPSAFVGYCRLSDRARELSLGRDRRGIAAVGSCAGQEDGVWHVGVGCAFFMGLLRAMTTCAQRRMSSSGH